MDQEKLRAIWTEIVAEAKAANKEKRPEERTLREFMNDTGMSKYQATMFLEQQVKSGKLTKRLYQGANLYCPVLGE